MGVVARALLAAGGVLAVIGFGFGTWPVDGCGSGFAPKDGYGVPDSCVLELSGRSGTAWLLLGPGLALVAAGTVLGNENRKQVDAAAAAEQG